MTSDGNNSELQRMGWLERNGDDFPFYRGQPVTLTTMQWLIILASVATGFACLIMPIPLLTGELGLLMRTLLFPAIPMLTLRVIAGPHWRSLFRRLRPADLGWMFAFALLNLIVTIAVGALVMSLFGADSNAAIDALSGQTATQNELFFLRSLPQLFGEEVLTILPFLAVLYFAHAKLRLRRTYAVLLAWLLSSIIFGLVHLPSYNWNLLQCLVVIGSARLILSLAYIRTKNIWVSTGAHVINDWVIFALVLSSLSASSA